MSSSDDRHWDGETDLLVIGAGAGGMTAALVGTLEGLRVVLCEKSETVGGTTAMSAGTVWIPGSRQSETAGLADSIEAAKIYLRAMLGDGASDERLSAYLASGPAALDYLERRTNVVFTPPHIHPDYRSLPGAAIGGRALSALPFDGRLLGPDFDRVRPPRRDFMILGGMMVGKNDIAPLIGPFRSWSNFKHAFGLLARQAWDRFRFKRGTRLLMGNALVGRLLYDLRRLAVDIRYRTALKELVKVGDEIVGAVLTTPTGEFALFARKGVVLATGGIGWSDELRKRLFPENARRYSLAPDCNTGDGIRAGERALGEIVNGLDSPALWMPSSVMTQPDGHLSIFPHIMLDRAKPGLLAVDRSGRRFVNEADSYHDFVLGMLQSNRSPASVPSYLVCDRSFIADYGLGLVHPGARGLRRFIEAGYLYEGSTILDLAERLGVEGAALNETVERYNRYAETGNDEEFGRGKSELNRFNGDPLNKPNPCLRKVGPGPYYAVAVWPSDLASSAGLRTDSRGRVMTSGGNRLKGLYAAGTDAASIFRGTYPGPGTMIGPAIVFAWRIAMDAAGTLDDSSMPTGSSRTG
jgi:succinate dehydrogenase/fumarate reductase flavoprotein subunit